ncbi:hypothetical protein [Burkholderia cepacia]|uniref:hypothetical protein n=1 Tax=Burkholderia cepacia TaxID=292 RepID=UPI001591ABD2|nr:hypothetical protein [Burkholderia cepacia]MDN7639263.1 hypothetical protein [Burkholderia cepacia]
MPIEDFLDETLGVLEQFYSEMQPSTGAVLYREVGPHRQFRHVALTNSLACYLKGVKTVSTLRACVLLLRHGYTQEVGALCRMADDFCNEIFFLLVPQGQAGYSDDQVKFLENFYQEEFERPDDPLRSPQKRDTVPAKKIHATFGKLAADDLNPSDAQELLRTTQQAFSGYVHGAYPHIMELFGGDPARFHMSGMLGTPRIDEWRAQLVGYVHRLIMVTILVARKQSLLNLEAPLRAFLADYEGRTGTKPKITASKMLAEYKKDRAT